MDANTTARIPPNDIQAEEAVLSCMLFDRESVVIAYEMLRGEDFYRPDYRIIYEALIDLFLKNVPIDVVTLCNKLTENAMLESVGGTNAIATIAAAFYTSANIRHYAKIVSDRSVLRRLIRASTQITNESFEAADDVDNIIDRAEKGIFDIAQGRNISEFTPLSEVLNTAVDHIEMLSKNAGQITGVPTGFYDLDNKTAGLQPAELILLGARPSMGKSALMLNIAHSAAVVHNIPTAFFSLEMSKEQLVSRLICAEGTIDSQKLRTGDLNDADWLKIADAIGTLQDGKLYFDDTAAISIAQLRSKCRRLKIEKGLGLVLIDYLQLMTGSSSRYESRQQEISDISRSLKALAKDLECPVFTAAQLSRACEQRADHRPILSDLRESGAIEQDADVVMFLYRDEYYNPDTEKKGMAEVILAKHRNGPTGTVELAYLNKYTKFVNTVQNFN